MMSDTGAVDILRVGGAAELHFGAFFIVVVDTTLPVVADAVDEPANKHLLYNIIVGRLNEIVLHR